MRVEQGGTGLTQWMAAGELRLLRVFGSELVTDAVQQLDVALLGVLLHSGDEGPGHGAGSLCGNSCIGPIRSPLAKVPQGPTWDNDAETTE